MELTQTQKTVFWVLGGLILIVLVIFFIKLYKENKAKKAQKEKDADALAKQAANIQPPPADTSKEALENIQNNIKSLKELSEKQAENMNTEYNDGFPLRFGSVGKRVEQLQMFMLKKWGWQGKVDGKWGTQTQSGVEKYLKAKEVSEPVFGAYNLASIKTNIFK